MAITMYMTIVQWICDVSCIRITPYGVEVFRKSQVEMKLQASLNINALVLNIHMSYDLWPLRLMKYGKIYGLPLLTMFVVASGLIRQ